MQKPTQARAVDGRPAGAPAGGTRRGLPSACHAVLGGLVARRHPRRPRGGGAHGGRRSPSSRASTRRPACRRPEESRLLRGQGRVRGSPEDPQHHEHRQSEGEGGPGRRAGPQEGGGRRGEAERAGRAEGAAGPAEGGSRPARGHPEEPAAADRRPAAGEAGARGRHRKGKGAAEEGPGPHAEGRRRVQRRPLRGGAKGLRAGRRACPRQFGRPGLRGPLLAAGQPVRLGQRAEGGGSLQRRPSRRIPTTGLPTGRWERSTTAASSRTPRCRNTRPPRG